MHVTQTLRYAETKRESIIFHQHLIVQAGEILRESEAIQKKLIDLF